MCPSRQKLLGERYFGQTQFNYSSLRKQNNSILIILSNPDHCSNPELVSNVYYIYNFHSGYG